jgi:cytochrome b561
MKKWSSTFRIWHWLFMLTFLFMSATVIIRETVLDKQAVSAVIIEDLGMSDINISKDDAIDMAKDIRSPLWESHVLVGYLFAGLVVARYMLFATRSGRRNYINCSEKTLHKKGVSATYLGIYGFATLLALSGLGMKFNAKFDLSEELVHTIKEVHEFAFYAMLILVIAHIAGVIIAENSSEKGIVSDMINGGEEK